MRAFEAYEYGREPNVIWLHLVKLTAEVVVSELQVRPSRFPYRPFHLWHPTRLRPVTPISAVSSSQELPQEERKRYTQQISHISADLKTVMERREQVESE